MIVTISIFGALILFFLINLIIGKLFFKKTFSRRADDEHFSEHEDIKTKNSSERMWLWSNKIDEITISSKDNLKLKGYFIKNNTNKLAILVHGYHGRYYSMTKQAKFMYEKGFNLLLINNRAHDTSEGKYFSMGKKESDDLLIWINLMLSNNPNYNIVLFGASMGAHIVMMMEGYKLNKNVKAIISDSGYDSLNDELKFQVSKLRIPFKKYLVFCGNIYAILFHNFSFKNETKNAFKDAGIPMLLLQGDEDEIVSYKCLKNNYESLPNDLKKKMITFKGARHLEGIHTHFDLYKESVYKFLDELGL